MAARKASPPIIESTAIEGEVVEAPLGRDVTVTPKLTVRALESTGDQKVVVAKAMRLAERRPERSVEAMGLFFQVLEKLLVNREEDGPEIDTALIEGEVTVEKLARLFFTTEDDDEPQAAVKRVRRS